MKNRVISIMLCLMLVLTMLSGCKKENDSFSSDENSENVQTSKNKKKQSIELVDSIYELKEENIAQDEETLLYYTNNIILAFIESGLTEKEKESIAEVVDGKIVAQLAGSINLLQIEVKVSSLSELDQFSKELIELEEVYHATPDLLKKQRSATVDNDRTYFGENEWWIDAVDVKYVWDNYETYIINKTKVGVVDSIVNMEHNDIKEKIEFANEYYSEYNKQNLVLECNNAEETFDTAYVDHGTAVSGIIAANRNDFGITGVSHKTDVLFASFKPNEPDWERISGTLYAFEQIIQNKEINVVNFSLQNVYYDRNFYDQQKEKEDPEFEKYNTYSEYRKAEAEYSEREAKAYAAALCETIKNKREILVVQCAGNGVNNGNLMDGKIPFGVDARFAGIWANINNVTCKETFEEFNVKYEDVKNRILIVGSVTDEVNAQNEYIMTNFSNYGKGVVDICAPGTSIKTCNSIGKNPIEKTNWETNWYTYVNGTSFSAPMVTGAAAILWGIDPTLEAAEVKDFILKGARGIALGVGEDAGNEYPMLNVRGAVEELLKTKAVSLSVGDKDDNSRIQDATVSYGNGLSATTDIIGGCDIYLIDDNHEITVSKEGYKTVTVTVEDEYIGQDSEWIDVKAIYLEKESETKENESDNSNDKIEYDVQMEEHTLSLGRFHTAVIKSDGSLWGWGSNEYGEVGAGTNEEIVAPKKIMDDVKSVSLGLHHSAAIKEDGSLWMWGHNEYGQLGDGTYENKNAPVKIMDNVKTVSLGNYHSAAIKEDGTLWTWGFDAGEGRLGDGTDIYCRNTPSKIMNNVKTISLGNFHSGAIKNDGSLWMWGQNFKGQIGDGTEEDRHTPVKIMDSVKSISLGAYHNAAIKEDGSMWMWGENYGGQIEIGDGTTEERHTPVKIMDDVAWIALESHHGALIKPDGSLWTWGAYLGDGTMEVSDYPAKIMDNVVQVSIGNHHSGVIKTDGSLWMWGNTELGQLGIKSEDFRYRPEKIMDGVKLPNSKLHD